MMNSKRSYFTALLLTVSFASWAAANFWFVPPTSSAGLNVGTPRTNDLDLVDISMCEYMQRNYTSLDAQRVAFDKNALDYSSYMLTCLSFQGEISSEELGLLKALLTREYSDVAKASLLRCHLELQNPAVNEWDCNKLRSLINEFEGQSFEGCFGEFLSLYYKLHLVSVHFDGLDIEYRSAIDEFLLKYKQLASSGSLARFEDNTLKFILINDPVSGEFTTILPENKKELYEVLKAEGAEMEP